MICFQMRRWLVINNLKNTLGIASTSFSYLNFIVRFCYNLVQIVGFLIYSHFNPSLTPLLTTEKCIFLDLGCHLRLIKSYYER